MSIAASRSAVAVAASDMTCKAERFRVLPAARERFHRPVLDHLRRGQKAANVIHSQRRHHFQNVVAVAVLRAEFEVGLAAHNSNIAALAAVA
jgi:hypothetical protein